jgi:hypothetical protein
MRRKLKQLLTDGTARNSMGVCSQFLWLVHKVIAQRATDLAQAEDTAAVTAEVVTAVAMIVADTVAEATVEATARVTSH